MNLLNKLKKINKPHIDVFNKGDIDIRGVKISLRLRVKFLKVIIKDKNIFFDHDKTIEKNSRIFNYKKGLTIWFNWVKKNNIKLKDGYIFINVSDTYNYGKFDSDTLIMTKPKNKKGVLFPDDSWFCTKIDNECHNQDKMIKIFIKNCVLPYKNREEELFFKGANTGKINNKGILKWNTRELLEKYYKDKRGFNIILNTKKIPPYAFCNYQILFNLPGHQPWSYRFREILLTCSLVVDIAVEVSYDGGKNWNQKWVQFWYELFKPLEFNIKKENKDCKNCHYVQITIRYIEKDEEYNKKQFKLLTDNIDSLNEDIKLRPKYYENIAKRGCKLMRTVDMNTVYGYINYVWNSLN